MLSNYILTIVTATKFKCDKVNGSQIQNSKIDIHTNILMYNS